MQLKKDVEVLVLAGDNKGKKGRVLKVLRESHKVIVEGVNLHKKHLKKTQENPNGSIIAKELPIDISNVMTVERHEQRVQKRAQRASK